MQILGPGSVGENADWAVASGYDGSVMLLKSHDLLAGSGPVQAAHCSGARRGRMRSAHFTCADGRPARPFSLGHGMNRTLQRCLDRPSG